MNARGQLVLVLAALLAGCAPVGPDYVRPETVVPPAYKGITAAWTPAQPGDTLPKGKWWELFGDRQLNALAERVDPGNQSIRQAEARYAQAQALLRQAQAQRIPLELVASFLS
jgi:outer membrane protein TolC